MTPSDIRAVVDRLEAVPLIEYCYCGHPRSEHQFYDDKIYDVQGLTCPTRLGGEFRHDILRSKERWLDAKVSVLAVAIGENEHART